MTGRSTPMATSIPAPASTTSSRISWCARQSMLGKDAPYVPGWDCHGLPIEWKVEEKYRAEGKSKDESRPIRCAATAATSPRIGSPSSASRSSGWAASATGTHPYTTMDFRAEAAIAGELHKFVANGLLYRGFRPVMWSPVEKTALAEAEVEYHEKQSPTIYVKFPVVARTGRRHARCDASYLDDDALDDPRQPRHRVFAKRWPTASTKSPQSDEGALAQVGEKLLLADVLAEQTAKHAKITLKRIARCRSGQDWSAPIRFAARATISTCRCCRRSCHRRHRHRLCAHRARPWRRRLRA